MHNLLPYTISLLLINLFMPSARALTINPLLISPALSVPCTIPPPTQQARSMYDRILTSRGTPELVTAKPIFTSCLSMTSRTRWLLMNVTEKRCMNYANSSDSPYNYANTWVILLNCLLDSDNACLPCFRGLLGLPATSCAGIQQTVLHR